MLSRMHAHICRLQHANTLLSPTPHAEITRSPSCTARVQDISDGGVRKNQFTS